MGMTCYTAHAYVASGDGHAYFELTFDNEMEPEIVLKDSFIEEFALPEARKKLISDSFDANHLWEDDPPHTLTDEIDDHFWDDEMAEEFDQFCKKVKKMKNIDYVIFAVDSDTENWRDFKTYWYDAKVIDFNKNSIFSIEWRGTPAAVLSDNTEEEEFDEITATKIVKLLSEGRSEQIDVGDFKRNGKQAGKVTEKKL